VNSHGIPVWHFSFFCQWSFLMWNLCPQPSVIRSQPCIDPETRKNTWNARGNVFVETHYRKLARHLKITDEATAPSQQMLCKDLIIYSWVLLSPFWPNTFSLQVWQLIRINKNNKFPHLLVHVESTPGWQHRNTKKEDETIDLYLLSGPNSLEVRPKLN
jgi:hypothetical protein